MKGGILLSDEDIRHFICAGFVQLQSELDDAMHRRIDERLRSACMTETTLRLSKTSLFALRWDDSLAAGQRIF